MHSLFKAREVVEDARAPRFFGGEPDLSATILKKSGAMLFGGNASVSQLPPRDRYLDEVNRLRVEIRESETMLRALQEEIELARYEAAHPPQPEPVPQPEQEVAPALEAAPQPVLESEYTGFASPEEIRALVDEARAEAEEVVADIIARAKTEGINIVQDAENRGFLDGFNKGFAQSVEEYKAENDPKIQQLDVLLDKLSDFYEDEVRSNEAEMTKVIMAIAEKIIGRELKSDPNILTDMLRETLEDNKREDFIKITISADLLPVEAKASAAVIKIITDIAPAATLAIDKEAETGTCIMETNKGYTDMSVATQLDNVGSALVEQ